MTMILTIENQDTTTIIPIGLTREVRRDKNTIQIGETTESRFNTYRLIALEPNMTATLQFEGKQIAHWVHDENLSLIHI